MATESIAQATTRAAAEAAGTPGTGGEAAAPGGLAVRDRHSTEIAGLASDRGSTSIADAVVAKIAGLAAREVHGVHALGGGVARAIGAVRRRVPGGRPNVAQGIRVEVGTRQAAVDVDLVVEYGVPIAELAAAVRENIISSVETMTGLEVVEVNINVDDIHLPGDPEPQGRVLA
jgi:uncharacterized alkaline shock family protein YloU